MSGRLETVETASGRRLHLAFVGAGQTLCGWEVAFRLSGRWPASCKTCLRAAETV